MPYLQGEQHVVHLLGWLVGTYVRQDQLLWKMNLALNDTFDLLFSLSEIQHCLYLV